MASTRRCLAPSCRVRRLRGLAVVELRSRASRATSSSSAPLLGLSCEASTSACCRTPAHASLINRMGISDLQRTTTTEAGINVFAGRSPAKSDKPDKPKVWVRCGEILDLQRSGLGVLRGQKRDRKFVGCRSYTIARSSPQTSCLRHKDLRSEAQIRRPEKEGNACSLAEVRGR